MQSTSKRESPSKNCLTGGSFFRLEFLFLFFQPAFQGTQAGEKRKQI